MRKEATEYGCYIAVVTFLSVAGVACTWFGGFWTANPGLSPIDLRLSEFVMVIGLVVLLLLVSLFMGAYRATQYNQKLEQAEKEKQR